MASEGGDFQFGNPAPILFVFKLAQDIGKTTGIDVGLDEVTPPNRVGFEFIFLGETLGHKQLRTSAKRTDKSTLIAQKELKQQRWTHHGDDLTEHMLLRDVGNFVRNS